MLQIRAYIFPESWFLNIYQHTTENRYDFSHIIEEATDI